MAEKLWQRVSKPYKANLPPEEMLPVGGPQMEDQWVSRRYCPLHTLGAAKTSRQDQGERPLGVSPVLSKARNVPVHLELSDKN